MKIPLSNRLAACASFVQPGARVADIGCDHGYLSIHLLVNHIASHIIAADINPQPLESAKRNAEKYGIDKNIEFCLSDGVASIPRDFGTLLCAGMGADTMISILGNAGWLKDKNYRLILQCQSKRPELRKWLCDNGWQIAREILAEDGKFIYPVMEVTYSPGNPLTPAQYYISPALLRSNDPLLPRFYDRVIDRVKLTCQGLAQAQDPQLSHYQQILQELLQMEAQINDHS